MDEIDEIGSNITRVADSAKDTGRGLGAPRVSKVCSKSNVLHSSVVAIVMAVLVIVLVA